MSVPLDPNSSPEELFESFVESGVDDFKAFLAKYPQHAEGLQALYERREQVARELEESLMAESFLHRSTRLGDGPFASAFRVTEGMVIGDYRVLRLLGRGGMGEVWEAEQASLSRRVALKLLLPERVDQKGLEFFAREARAGGRLSHPGIVAIHGTGEDEGLHWIAMELVEEACDLRRSMDAMRDEDELPEDYYHHVAEFIAEAAEALEVAHDAGVIHRDLKPGNILVTSDDRPKISDFGLAKLTDEHSISLAGDLVGTYYYMSPEQVAAKRTGLDHRTDVFSLGVVLYEMLTLVRPFEGDTTEQVAHKIMVVDPPSAKEVRSKVPQDLAVICGKAIEKNRDHRYASMAELAADLRRHLANEPILAKPSGALVRIAKWARRNPTKIAAGAGVVSAVVLVALSFFYAQLLEEQGATAQALEIASEERDLAEQHADELRQLSNFQARQLSGVDPQAMGIAIRTMLLERARAAGEQEGRGPEVLEEERAELERLVMGADFTGIALGVLDEQVFERALQEIEVLGNQPLVQALLLQTMATTLRDLGLLERALEPQEQALEIRRRELGDEHPDTLLSINNLASLLLDLGKYDDAESLYRESLEGSRLTLGDEHPDTLLSISNLGGLFRVQGKYDEAELLTREALEVRRRMLGDEHPSTMNSINNLGLLLYDQGKLGEAEPLLREALEGLRRTLGDEHPSTLRSINNLGLLLYAQGKLDEAAPLLFEAFEGSRRTLGDEHPNTLGVAMLIGGLLESQGKYDEAESLMRGVVETSRRTLGDEHPSTLRSINNLASLLRVQGKYDEAESLYRESLEGLRRTLGNEHPDTLQAKRNLEKLLSERDGSETPPTEDSDR